MLEQAWILLEMIFHVIIKTWIFIVMIYFKRRIFVTRINFLISCYDPLEDIVDLKRFFYLKFFQWKFYVHQSYNRIYFDFNFFYYSTSCKITQRHELKFLKNSNNTWFHDVFNHGFNFLKFVYILIDVNDIIILLLIIRKS